MNRFHAAGTRNVMTKLKHLILMLTVTTTVGWRMVVGETLEVCNGEDFVLSCPDSEIIIVNWAEYGRKEVGRCIPEADQFMGCTNDVLPLLDRWCSGRRECQFSIPNNDLEKENSKCLKILRLYIKVDYTCMKVDSVCNSNGQNRRENANGHLTSYQADKRGCGLRHSPWLLSASPGQTITLTMRDFSVQADRSNLASCPVAYGVIHEKALRLNHSICGGRKRQSHVYSSKTNEIEVHFLPKLQRGGGQFIIEYKVTGCPELNRPAHAWYRREGNKAVVGCESGDKEWQLTCVNDKWIGDIGNCTNLVEVVPSVKTTHLEVQFSSVVVMTGIAGVAIVLCVVAIVAGVVYIHKYRLRQETKRLKKIYDEAERSTLAYYGDRTLTMDPNSSSGWPAPHGHLTSSYVDQCSCATLPARADAHKTLTGSLDEKQSLYSSIKST